MNNATKKERTRAEKILTDIETKLRELINKRKELEAEFRLKVKELDKQRKENEKWFEDNLKEANKIENQMMLLWDYWNREVQILKLEKKIQVGVLPSERAELMKEIQELNKHNITIQKGFQSKKIDPEIVAAVRKKIGVWEGGEK